MRKLLPLFALAFIAACQDAANVSGPGAGGAFTPSRAVVQGTQSEVIPGVVLARFASGAPISEIVAANELAVAGQGYQGSFVILRGAIGNERALAARLANDPRVEFAQPDYARQLHAVDPRLWAFVNPGGLSINYTNGPNAGSPVSSLISKADADEDNVEGYAAGGAQVVIGSIDTGVDLDHPAFLPGQLIAGHDWWSNDANPEDEDGHGTHTTGTMAGQTVGVAGVSGAGPNVKVLVQRVCGPRFCSTSGIASAIRAAADYDGMVAVNVSIGGGDLSTVEQEAIAYATSRNVLVIASAGNGSTGTVDCPACDPNAISVAASDWMDEHAYYTNWGSGLDLIAPGGELYSNTTEQAGIYSSYLGGTYRYLQGTSMAAPQVTGAAAVVASVTGLRGAELRARLLSTVDDLGAGDYDTNFGHGRLNVYRAVTGNTLQDGTGGGGQTLTAAFSVSCKGGATCDFDGTSSSLATSWSWNFGDGTTETGSTVSHTYAAEGNYTVSLTVGGSGSGTASTSQTVSCTAKGPKLRCR
jgi:serine protease